MEYEHEDEDEGRGLKRQCTEPLVTIPEITNRPLPFTCIHYAGEFKVTDSDGMFVTPEGEDPDKHKIMRCEEDDAQNVVYTYIRTVHTSDLEGLDNIDELNVLKNLSTNNKSLYY